MADNLLPEEFLFDFNRAIETLSGAQSKLNDKLGGMSDSLEDLSLATSKLGDDIKTKGANPNFVSSVDELIGRMDSLNSSLEQQARNNEQSNKELFSILNPLGGINAGEAVRSLPRFEEGGTMSNAGVAVVGEAGPELVVLPENAEISPLDTNIFDQFSTYLTSIDPSDIIKTMLGAEKLIIQNENGVYKAYPDLKSAPNNNFEPFDINEKIKSQIIQEEQILSDQKSTSIQKEESADVLKLLDYFKDYVTQLNYQPEENELNTVPITTVEQGLQQTELTANTENTAENVSQPQTLLNQPASEIETSTITGTNTGLESVVAKTEASPQTELSVVKQELATPVISASPQVKKELTEQTTVQNQTINQTQQSSQQSIKFPETMNVNITKYEEGEKQFKEMKQMLSSIYSALQKINTNGRDIMNSNDNYPIRPSSRNF